MAPNILFYICMTEKQAEKMIDHICDHILTKQFNKYDVDVPEALTVLAKVAIDIMRSICFVYGLDIDQMLDRYCNAIQQEKKVDRTYTTGSEDCDELLAKVVTEMKDGVNIEEIVDKYVNCENHEIRQELIDGMNAIRERHEIDNVKIGYKHD